MGVMDWMVKLVSSLTKTVLFVVGLIILLIPLVYFLGSFGEKEHVVDPHPLYHIFEQNDYYKLEKALSKKTDRRIILHEDFNGGLWSFVDHYANTRTNKG